MLPIHRGPSRPTWIPPRWRSRSRLLAVAALVVGWLLVGRASGQAPPSPPLPGPSPATSPPGPPVSREAELEAKLRRYEAMLEKLPDPDHVAELEATVRQLSGQVDDLSHRLATAEADQAKQGPGGGSGRGGEGGGGGSKPDGGGGSGGGGSVGQAGPVTSGEMSPDAEMPPPMRKRPLKATVGSGIELATDDDEFNFQLHTLAQFDGRFYGQYNQYHSREPFAVPLGLVFFTGRLSKPIQYSVGLGNTFGAFDIFYAFLNLNYDDRLQFRIGRQKQPVAYEWYEVPLYGQINIERSMFFNNFFPGFTRDGAMVLGELFDKRVEYNVGLFESQRQLGAQTFEGRGRFFSLAGLLDARPFGASGNPALEHLHVGGSVFTGARNGPPTPRTFWSVIPTIGNAGFGIPFLQFRDNVNQTGDQTLWTTHLAYYFKQLSFIGEIEGGFADYNKAGVGDPRIISVPIAAWYAQVGYFLTGERVVRRDVVEPTRPFDLRPGRFGLGALEATFRYNEFFLGREIFTRDLADANLWTNQVRTTDLGFNWYWNRYIKIIFDWQHAAFGNPVQFTPTRSRLAGDSFFFRFQINY